MELKQGSRVRIRMLLATLGITFSALSTAEIEKIAMPSKSGFSFHWWPKLTLPTGWHHERDQSLANGINAIAPDGFTFGDAETVMYAKAIYKPRDPELKSLDMLIARDRKDFLENEPSLKTSAATSLATGDGRQLKSVVFSPTTKGNWERVTYGEEGEFYLVFVVSSRSESGFKKSSKAYEQLVRGYKEKP
jgi:hypothetical protein